MRLERMQERLAGLPVDSGAHTMLRRLSAEERLIDDAGERCAIALADGLAERLGPGARKWTRGLSEIPRERALGILIYVLSRDLVYSTQASPFLLTPDEAARLADDLLSCLSDDARFFTNGRPEIKDHGDIAGLSSWVTVTGATFDWGVVWCDRRYIGYVWAEAED